MQTTLCDRCSRHVEGGEDDPVCRAVLNSKGLSHHWSMGPPYAELCSDCFKRLDDAWGGDDTATLLALLDEARGAAETMRRERGEDFPFPWEIDTSDEDDIRAIEEEQPLTPDEATT
jgi:hypothetical protein